MSGSKGARRSVSARTLGDVYQSRYFWLQALRMIDETAIVERVAFEFSEAPHFDDVVTWYDQKRSWRKKRFLDAAQTKFHVVGSSGIRLADLAEPVFLGRKSKTSLLQRLKNAHTAQPDGLFHLVTPSPIHPDDFLGKLHRQEDFSLRVNELFSSGPRSEIGKARIHFQSHLGIDSDSLKVLLSALRIEHARSFPDIDRLLNERLRRHRLPPYEEKSSNPYDMLPYALSSQSEVVWEASDLRRVITEEFGWTKASLIGATRPRFGVRQFLRFAEDMEGRVDALLELESYFDHRRPREATTWESVKGMVTAFIQQNVEGLDAADLILAVPLPLAYVIGSAIRPKAPVALSIEQGGTSGTRLWNLTGSGKSYRPFTFDCTELSAAGTDLAVVISLTHSVRKAALDWLHDAKAPIGSVIEAHLENAGSASVEDGAHCVALADQLVQHLLEADPRAITVHVFISAPKAFAVALGRAAHRLPRVQLYEFDFEIRDASVYFPTYAV